MKRFKVVCCPRCRRYQVVYAEETFRCKFCGYTTELKRLNIFYQTDNALKAARFVQTVKERKTKP